MLGLRSKKRLIALGVTVAFALLASAAPALAVAPPSSAKSIVTEGFETGTTPKYVASPIYLSSDPPPAYWGARTNWKRTGLRSLWCAGSNGTATSYPAGTAGRVTFSIPDVYSASVTFYYYQPSLGPDDASALNILWNRPDIPKNDAPHNLPIVSAWTGQTFDLTAPTNEVNMSRGPGTFAFNFISDADQGQTGTGPAIDDVVIRAYKYGPVRSLSATRVGGTVELSWAKPYGSTGTTVEDTRSLAYRIWRAPQSAPTAWTELTGENGAARITATSFVDSSPSPYATRYFVQAWDTGTGTEYGQGNPAANYALVPTLPDAPPAVATAVARTSGAATLAAYGASYAFKGTLTKDGAPFEGQTVRLQQGPTANGPFADSGLTGTTGPTGAFTINVSPKDYTYYRASYPGVPDVYLASASTATGVMPRAYVSTPIAPRYMRSTKSYTVYGSLKPRHSAGSAPVRIYRWKKRSTGGWKPYGYVTATASDQDTSTSKYTRKLRLKYRGKWRLRAYAPADSKHAAAWSSGYDYVTVK